MVAPAGTSSQEAKGKDQRERKRETCRDSMLAGTLYGPGRGLRIFCCRFCFFTELSVSRSCLSKTIIVMLFYLYIRACSYTLVCVHARAFVGVVLACVEKTRTVRVFITFCPAAHARLFVVRRRGQPCNRVGETGALGRVHKISISLRGLSTLRNNIRIGMRFLSQSLVFFQ